MPNSVFIDPGQGTHFAIPGQTVGDLFYADSATTIARLADVATGQVLVSGGVGAAPAYSATPSVTSLTVASAGTLGWADVIQTRAAAGVLGLNQDSTHGVRLDVTTDGTAQFLTRAGADTATVRSHIGHFGALPTGATAGGGARLVLGLSGESGGVFLLTDNDRAGTVNFGDPQDNNVGYVEYAHDVNAMRFGVNAATRLTIDSGGVVTVPASVDVGTGVRNTNATNGQTISALQTLTELTTIAAAATTDTTIQMPAGAVILGVAVRVTTVIPTATNFTVGDSGSAARFSTAAVSSAANSTDPGTKAGAYYNASALSVRITPDVQPADNTGRVRVVIYYYTVTPPTS